MRRVRPELTKVDQSRGARDEDIAAAGVSTALDGDTQQPPAAQQFAHHGPRNRPQARRIAGPQGAPNGVPLVGADPVERQLEGQQAAKSGQARVHGGRWALSGRGGMFSAPSIMTYDQDFFKH
jgi:hypothetical protein